MPVAFWLHPERTREPRLAFLLALACVSLCLSGQRAIAQTSIGLYTDPSGSTCSFTGNAPGLVTAYVVVRPADGVSAVQFAAPIPGCLGATFVSETVPAGMLSLGSSQTGISIALQNCSILPINVLQVTYLRSGSTEPCCEFNLVADPSVGSLVATDCFFNTIPMVSTHSHFNADASCECVGNSPPAPPTSPSPYESETNVSVQTSLSWYGADYDNNIVGYDLYLGTTPSPALFVSGLTGTTFVPPTSLEPLTQHYWRVVARDAGGLETSGVTWSFTTRDVNTAPYVPLPLAPANGAHDIALNSTLRWIAADIDDDVLSFDLYFGTTNPPPLVAGNLSEMIYVPGTMPYETQHYWRIVVHDSYGHETTGPIWSFHTRLVNYPPNFPNLVAPPHGSIGQLLTTQLIWTTSDIDGDTLVSDLFFGDSTPPPLVATSLTSTTYSPVLAFSTQYYWQVRVRDHRGGETLGQVWTFTTRPENFPPSAPSNPTPANNATNRPENTVLFWQCSDLDNHSITYDVYFGTQSPPPLVATNIATKSFSPGLLAVSTTYRWRIVARDQLGAETSGPTWTFTTRANLPPDIPFGPTPANASTNRPITQTLAWLCNDPNGDPMTFDVYFGTTASPPLVASNHPTKSYNPGQLLSFTTYRWKIVARDSGGLERAGPIWSFTTKANTPPTVPSNPSPPNNGAGSFTPTLSWTSSDTDGHPLTFDVHFGTQSPPPLVAAGLTEPHYQPGTLPEGNYFWQVDVSDGLTTVSGPVWTFLATQLGDANMDGEVTLADATCAFDTYLGDGPCVASNVANVDCIGGITPGDARCIHAFVENGSCDFCGAPPEAAAQAPAAPLVILEYTWEWDDTLYARLDVNGLPSLAAFGFTVDAPTATLVRAVRRGATESFERLRAGPNSNRVGGYALDTAPVGPLEAFVDLLFVAPPNSSHLVIIHSFVDDLDGAPAIVFTMSRGGGTVPVLISRFQASVGSRHVRVDWQLESDEALNDYTLFRRDKDATALRIVSQGLVSKIQSYIDPNVEAGKTYHYELVVRTMDGNEFRSPVATVTTGALSLSLGQNHPNPFNPRTSIPYELPVSAMPQRVRLWILDISGRIVATLVNEEQSSGAHRVEWQGKNDRGDAVSSGVYFYVLDVNGDRRTRKLVLLK